MAETSGFENFIESFRPNLVLRVITIERTEDSPALAQYIRLCMNGAQFSSDPQAVGIGVTLQRLKIFSSRMLTLEQHIVKRIMVLSFANILPRSVLIYCFCSGDTWGFRSTTAVPQGSRPRYHLSLAPGIEPSWEWEPIVATGVSSFSGGTLFPSFGHLLISMLLLQLLAMCHCNLSYYFFGTYARFFGLVQQKEGQNKRPEINR